MSSKGVNDSYPLNVQPPPKKKSPSWSTGIVTGICVCLWLTNWGLRMPVIMRDPYLIKATNGAVASENILCSNIGVQTLKDGGNAVDAAVATTICIGVVNMYSSGIGGGGFLTLRIPSSSGSKIFTLDFRERAPALANTTLFEGRPEASWYGGLAVGIPGELRGLEAIHSRWGKLPWRSLVEPSVHLAAGWKVDVELAFRIAYYPYLMLNNPQFARIFSPNGTILQEGETIYRTNYSRTLATIAELGSEAMYSGPIANAIVKITQETGGILTLDDMKSYRVKMQPALRGTYRGKHVYTTHAPSSGPVLLHMLNLLEKFDLSEGKTVLNVHRFIETLKFGFAARTWIGDPAFHNDTSKIERIHTKKYADSIFPKITNRTHFPPYYHPQHNIKTDHGTSHISIVDKDGMAIAITSTINTVFGSQVMDEETGIILNNEMNDFSLPPGVPNEFGLFPSPYNYPDANKTPLSSMIPTILENEDGSLLAVTGGSGGSRIFGAVAQVLLNIFEYGYNVLEAIEEPRFHDQLYPLGGDCEYSTPPWLVDGLRGSYGHNLTILPPRRITAVVEAIHLHDGHIFAASDRRKHGIAAGY